MTDQACVAFLQWALPRLHLRWPGFRKVRKQVCKRLASRLGELELADLGDYRGYLETHPAEWKVLDGLCRISISRFFRDRGVFTYLEQDVIPALLRQVAHGDRLLKCWSIGCASGEEPYTLAMLWKVDFAPCFPEGSCQILATDSDEHLLARARRACFPASSLKDLPDRLTSQAFDRIGDEWCLKPDIRSLVTFARQDVRESAPETSFFHLILCRNVVFTYFSEDLQRQVLDTILERLQPGGGLVIGSTESFPAGTWMLEPWAEPLRIYRKTGQLRTAR